MDTRKNPEEYFSAAMNCVQNGTRDDLQNLINLQFNIENSATQTSIYFLHSGSGSDSDDSEITGYEEIKTVAVPVFNVKEGEALLLEACTRKHYDIAKMLLSLTHLPDVKNPTIKNFTIPLTATLLRKILDIFSLQKINKKNTLSPDLDIQCITDITNKADKSQHEIFLKSLFICFIDQNITNTDLMIRLFNNVKKYFSDKSELFNDFIKHCLDIVCRSYENPVLFENLLLSIPEAREVISLNCELNSKVSSHYQLQMIYKPYILQNEVIDYHNVFINQNSLLFDFIQTMRKNASQYTYFFFESKFDKLLSLENNALQILSNGTTSIQQFEKIVRLLIAERDFWLLQKQYKTGNHIHSFLMDAFKKDHICSIFSYSSRRKYDLPTLQIKSQNFYTYNFLIERLPKEYTSPKP